MGRSIPSRVEINGLRPPLTAFSLLGNPPQAFFPLSLSRSAHLYTNSVGMCALRGFCKIQTLASIGKCDPTRDRVGVHIARLLGSILRPLFQLDIYGEPEPSMDSHFVPPLTPLHYVSLFSPKGASPLMDTPIHAQTLPLVGAFISRYKSNLLEK